MPTEEVLKSLELKLRGQRTEIVAALALNMGRLSRMDAMAQIEMSQATRTRMEKELRQEAIEASRLQSDPATPFCLPCYKEVSEQRGGRCSAAVTFSSRRPS